MAAKIYTKTGDKGETSLFGGARVPKHHVRLEAYGTVDELNSHLGECRTRFNELSEETTKKHLDALLEQAQNSLFNLGSHLACTDPKMREKLPALTQNSVEAMEKAIDDIDKSLPPLRQFILPGGHPAASALHLARTVCRRAERRTMALKAEEEVAEPIITYLNRLSDLLFVMARKANASAGIPDQPWSHS